MDIALTEARAALAELVNRVAYSGDRVTLTRHGRAVAAIISTEDLQRLIQLDQGPLPAIADLVSSPAATAVGPPPDLYVAAGHAQDAPRPGPSQPRA